MSRRKNNANVVMSCKIMFLRGYKGTSLSAHSTFVNMCVNRVPNTWPHDFAKKHIEHMYLPRKTRIDGERKQQSGGGEGGDGQERERRLVNSSFTM